MAKFEPANHVVGILHDLHAQVACLSGGGCFRVTHYLFDGHEDSTEVKQLGLPPCLAVESAHDIQSFLKHMHIVALRSVVLQNLQQVLYLLVILLLLNFILRGPRHLDFLRDVCWLCEDQREGKRAFVLDLLEESTQLQVFLYLVNELSALFVMSLSKQIVFLSVPIMEELEELNVLGENVVVFFSVEAPHYVWSYEAVCHYPHAVNVPQVMLLQVSDPRRLGLEPSSLIALLSFYLLFDEVVTGLDDCRSEVIDMVVDQLQVFDLEDDFVALSDQGQVCQ